MEGDRYRRREYGGWLREVVRERFCVVWWKVILGREIVSVMF